MPVIEDYDFGRIQIDGVKYTADVIIMPDRVIDSWWRKEGHNLCMDDLGAVLALSPVTLVIGTGYSGMMHVPRQLVAELLGKGVRVVVEPTPKAVETWNRLPDHSKAVAALHLTC